MQTRKVSVEKPKIVVMCGSSRFVDIMAVCAWIIEREEKAISMGLHLLPEWYCNNNIPDHLAEHEGVAEQMDNLHLRKIDISDEIFVINCNDYIGDSTKREIEYAKSLNKKIRWFTHDYIGEKVKEIINGYLRTAECKKRMVKKLKTQKTLQICNHQLLTVL